jgi:formylglycine-generating enzyme required for sulfatase activity
MLRPVSFPRFLSVVSLSALLSGLLLLDAGQAQPSTGKKYALLVGVRDYDSSKLDPLKYTENDAEDLAGVLGKQGGFTLRVLTTSRGNKNRSDAPTTANLRAEIKKLLAGKTRNDTILIALSGHGIQAEVKEAGKVKEENYFCPADAQLNDNSTLFSLGRLLRDFDTCGAGVKLLLVDACRNDPSAGRNVDVDSLPRPPRGTAVLFSCKGGERAFETPKLGKGHGIFFYHVIKGLEGEAKNKRGEVTWSSLVDHVIDKVSDDVPVLIASGARQTPEQKLNLTGRSPVLVGPGKTEVVAAGASDPTRAARRSANAFVNSIGMKLVAIDPGKFMMGSSKEEQDAVLQLIGDDEKKEAESWLRGEQQHEVEITKAYYLGCYEVTQAQYQKVMGNNPSHFSATGEGKDKVKDQDTGGFPVEMVSWHDAVKFCEKLSALEEEKKAGRVYRLPTEAEWEHACRAGTRTTFQAGAGLTSKQANFDGTYPFPAGTAEGPNLDQTSAVGRYKHNAWGLYDMLGNVQEWCSDCYDVKFYQSEKARKDPTGPASGPTRVLRGGSWHCIGRNCRTAYRNHYAPDSRYDDFGFRVACDVKATP